MPIERQSIATLPEAPATLGDHEGCQSDHYRRITPGPVHEGTIVRGPPQSLCSTGLLNLKASHHNQVRDNLSPLSRP